MTLIRQLDQGVIIINKHKNIFYTNDSFNSILSYSKEDLVKCKLNNIIHNDFKLLEHKIDFIFSNRNDEVLNCEIIFLNKHLEKLTVEISMSYILLNDESLCSILIKNIFKEDDKYKSLVEHNTDHIFQVDKNYKITYINHVAPGLVKEEVLGTSFINYLPNENSKHKVKNIADQVFKTGKPQKYAIDFEAPFGTMYYETNVTPLFDQNEVVRLNLITRDITDEYKYKLALEKKDDFLKKVNLNSQNGIYIYDLKKGQNVYSNAQCSSLLGYSLDEFNGMNSKQLISLFHPDDRERIFKHWKGFSKGNIEKTSFIVYRFKVKSGEWRWLRSKDSVFEYSEKGTLRKLMGSFIDITDLINLQNSESQLIKKNSEIENMLYQASHDIKSPINNVAQLIELSIENKEIQGSYLEIINQSVSRLNNLVISLLSFGEVEKNFTFEKVDLNKVLQEVLEDLQMKIDQTNAIISTSYLPKIKGSKIGLYRVFQNLINNALKFSRYKVPPVIDVKVEEKEEQWVFYVKDNGIGIVEEKGKNVFDAFTRLNSTSEYEGNGLGLANCKKIIEKHAGDIWVENNIEFGSEFIFTISKMIKN